MAQIKELQYIEGRLNESGSFEGNIWAGLWENGGDWSKKIHISGNSHLSDPDLEKGRQAEERCSRR